MDRDLEESVSQAIAYLQQFTSEKIDYVQMDPVAKMMLVALIHEGQKIRDYIDSTPGRVLDRYCTHFIPYEQVGAMPAITLLAPQFKARKDNEMASISNGAAFSYKVPDSKSPLNYIPIFETTLIPPSMEAGPYLLTHSQLTRGTETKTIVGDKPNRVWYGIVTKSEVECLNGLSLLISGAGKVTPEHIFVGADFRELSLSTMNEMENITMLEPFDAQQASGQFFGIINTWKDCLLNMDDATLLYITDVTRDRDLFKPKAYPRPFLQWFEDELLDGFDANTLWLRIDFPEGYTVPDTIHIDYNIVPVTNVDVNSLTLTQSAPIAKLQKLENSFFLRILETSSMAHKQGFNMNADELIIRDFDANCYHNGDLYRDVRTLYNRFIDDYYAFIEYNGIKDGEVLKRLRETINRLGKSVGESNDKFKFDSGTYVMKNMSIEAQSTTVKVSYATTMGEVGNTPKAGETMENKKSPFLEQKATVAVSAMGGADKASVDARYEMLRYYTLTNDRLYTKMDVDAFLRKEIMAEFGSVEFPRIFIRISVQGAGGDKFLQRGLYIDIEFKDKKNYQHAVSKSFDHRMRQKIQNHSCISMPIIVTLKNLEE